MRINKGELVKVFKDSDDNNGKVGIVIDIMDLPYNPVTFYTVEFEGGIKGIYFFSELKRTVI